MKCAECSKANACYQGNSCFDQGTQQPEYADAENRQILTIASRLEAEHYMQLTRVEELILFAQE
ncbi:MAG TPA: DUF1847 domain-containing protein, partial [Verrucomicrobiae bacterium]|nr:DUF1847 domain-containing protein [Verrucomicrobiae bacterium]